MEAERARRIQARTIKALAHPTRLTILAKLREGEICTCELQEILGLRQANISQHLAILRKANLVTTRREGLRVFYRVADDRIFEAVDLLSSITHDQFAEARRVLASMEASA